MFKNVIVWLVLLTLAWFAADIADKGQALNQLTPKPVFGYVLWGICGLVVWWLFVWPIIQFCLLRRVGNTSLHKRIRFARNRMKVYRGQYEKYPEKAQLYENLYNATMHGISDEDAIKILDNYQKIGDHPCRARKLIVRYSKVAGIAVVFSRNSTLDSLVLVVIQMKLVIELARLYGYKPSPMFNLLCFCWVLTHSLIFALSSGAVEDMAADAVGNAAGQLVDMTMDAAVDLSTVLADTILEDPTIVANATTKFLEKVPIVDLVSSAAKVVTKPLTEAFLAALPVYVTGHIFLRQLENEQTATFRTMLKLRREAYQQLFLSFASAAKFAVKRRESCMRKA